MLHASTEPDSACINPGTTESYQAFRRGEWERHIDLQAPVLMRRNAEQSLGQLHGSIRKFSAGRLMFDKKRLVLAQIFLGRGSTGYGIMDRCRESTYGRAVLLSRQRGTLVGRR